MLAVDTAHYAIGAELARGGMGRIVRARDLRLGRMVAIKEVLPGHDDTRFEREARITARLAHPAIVAIYEAGRWPSGQAFFAMKLVAGSSLDKVIVGTRTFAERLALVGNVITAVDALAYAHSERVIHRDLKPANVLVGKFGETVVIDWGLAKDLALKDDADDVAVGPYRGTFVAGPDMTVAGSVMGTPAYMAPEQAEGDPVDERADVYALGALLYHVLAGTAPYEGRTSDEVLQHVLAAAPSPLAERVPEAPIELVAIVERAMARAADARFANAGEMAAELRRFQTGQLVRSHDYTVAELVWRWVRKHRAPLAVAAIAVVTLAIVGIASVAKIVAETHRADQEAALAQARADRGTLERARTLLDVDPTQALVALRDLAPNAIEWQAARTIVADAAARGTAQILHDWSNAPITKLAFSADGRYLAGLSGSKLIAWDLETGVPSRLLAPTDQTQVAIAWEGDTVVHADRNGRIARWHPVQGEDDEIGTFAYDQIEIAPGGRWIAIAARTERGATGEIIELATSTQRTVGTAYALAWDAEGRTLLVWDRDRTQLRRIDAATGATTAVELPDSTSIHALAARGAHVVAGTRAHPLFALGGSAIPSGHAGLISLLVVLPDGRAASASSNAFTSLGADELDEEPADPLITIADGSTDVVRLRGHRTAITALTASAAGTIASADFGGEVRIWRRTPVEVTREPFAAFAGFVTPERDAVVLDTRASAVQIALRTGVITTIAHRYGADGPLASEEPFPAAELDQAHLPRDAAQFAMRAVTGDRWVTLDQGGTAAVWNRDGARILCKPESDRGLDNCNDTRFVAISAAGSRVATYDNDHLHLWDPATGVATDVVGSREVTALALSPDGGSLAVAVAADNHLLVITRAGTLTTRLADPQPTSITTLAFSPDASSVAAGINSEVMLFDRQSGAHRDFVGHEGEIAAISFTDDGRMITTSTDLTARVWSVADGSVRVLRGHTRRITTIEVHGDVAVTTSLDGTARLWDLRTETSRVLLGHDAPVVVAGIAVTGEIVTVDRDGRLARYRDDVPYGEAALRVWIAVLTSSGSSAITQ